MTATTTSKGTAAAPSAAVALSEPDAQFEARLLALQYKLGFLGSTTTTTTTTTTTSSSSDEQTIEQRLSALEKLYEAKLLTTPQLRTLWKESGELLQTLDPGAALTHQQQIVAPMLYRQQEILACRDQLSEQFQTVSRIAQYLTSSVGGASTAGSMDDWKDEASVTNAPLLVQMKTPSPEQQQRLLTLSETLERIFEQTNLVAAQLDHMLQQYQTLVVAASEKIVLAAERRQKS